MGQVKIVAEISGNHQGDLCKALELIRAARNAGADYVKFQAFTIDEILTLRGDGQAPAPWERYTKRQLYEKNQTPLEWFPTLFAYARKIGIEPFSTVMGRESLAVVKALNPPYYKLASYEFGIPWLRKAVQEAGPLIRSCAGPNAPPNRPGDLCLYCPPGYPVQSYDLRHLANGYDGLSLHSQNIDVAFAAACMGIQMLEVHLMLPHTMPLDQYFSYTMELLNELVIRVRRAERYRG